MTKKGYLWAAGILVMIAAIGWFSGSKLAKKSSEPLPETKPSEEQTVKNDANITAGDNVWLGTLKVSDSSARGNLMLVSTDGKATYIRTSRDFSGLLDKEVAVTIEGTAQSFKLIDIKAK